MGNTRRTFQKTQREMEKKRKAEQKRTDRQRKKEPGARPVVAEAEPDPKTDADS